MRPVVKSIRLTPAGLPLEFDPYGAAKPDLVVEIGSFCSFCEKSNTRSACHVEHIHAKKCVNALGTLIYSHLEFRWDNFLIGCVNCNSVKGNKDVTALNVFMPHQHNLMHFITVSTGGLIKIKQGVLGVDLARTKAFIDLVGLDRVPGDADFSDKDDRWDERLAAYDLATRYYQKYTNNPPTTDIENIVDLAAGIGFFSVWYEVFQSQDAVLDALINGINIPGRGFVPAFPGTHQLSFDRHNGYQTLRR
ncbi:hypothetical protein [Pedobacter panaciterrae]